MTSDGDYLLIPKVWFGKRISFVFIYIICNYSLQLSKFTAESYFFFQETFIVARSSVHIFLFQVHYWSATFNSFPLLVIAFITVNKLNEWDFSYKENILKNWEDLSWHFMFKLLNGVLKHIMFLIRSYLIIYIFRNERREEAGKRIFEEPNNTSFKTFWWRDSIETKFAQIKANQYYITPRDGCGVDIQSSDWSL